MSHPVVDRLDTRLLEDRQVVRSFVWSAEVAAVESRSLVLHTIDGVSSVFTRFPEGAPASPASRDRDHEPRHGSVRVDLLTDGIFRVRYAQAPQAPENPTEMVVGRFDGPAKAEVRSDSDRVVFETAEAVVEVGLEPFAIRVAGAGGEEVCRVGGREKNQWNLWDSYNTGVCRTAVGGRPVAVECFALRSREAIYGLGEQFIGLDKVGQTIDLNMVEATGTTTPRSYKNVPFFWSTRGYGIFFNHSSRMTCWIGSRCASDVQVALEDDFLDYFVILGDPKQILSRYTDITGKSRVPPKWSFGFWQSKISYRSAEEALEVVRRMREAGVPMDVLHLDTHWFRRDWCCDLEFAPERFPDPAGTLAALREQGVKVSLWQLPYIPEGSKLFDDLAAVEGFVKTQDGELYDVGLCYTPNFRGAVGCIDFTNPEARRVYQAYLSRLFDLGAKAIKVDFGEQAPVDGVYHDGTPGHRAHNLYPLLYNRTVAEVTEEATGESIIWARSAWAGSQRYPLHWGGDSSANWDNLVPQMAGGLSFGLSGSAKRVAHCWCAGSRSASFCRTAASTAWGAASSTSSRTRCSASVATTSDCGIASSPICTDPRSTAPRARFRWRARSWWSSPTTRAHGTSTTSGCWGTRCSWSRSSTPRTGGSRTCPRESGRIGGRASASRAGAGSRSPPASRRCPCT
jgi:hypothetical protein